MTLIPTKVQWKRWSLPSKVSYISLIIGIVGLFLSLWFQSQFGASKELQKQSIENQERLLKQGENISEQQEDITNDLKKRTNQMGRTNASELISKYPFGYILFSIDHRNIIIPNESVLLKDYEIGWDSAKILSITEDEVLLLLPTIIHLKDNVVSHGSISGGERKVGVIDHPIRISNTTIVIEILDDTKEGIIALIGFKP